MLSAILAFDCGHELTRSGMPRVEQLLLLLLGFPVRDQTAGIVSAGRVERFAVCIDVRNDALLVHHKSGAVCKAMLGVENPVLLGNRAVEVAEQREGDANLLGEGPVGRRTVHANAQHLSLRLLEFGEISLIRL
jgi:hypothetical protein